MTTVLEKELRRQLAVDDAEYILAISPEGFRLTGKGKRTPLVDLRWRDLLNGDAAMAVALNASLGAKRQTPSTEDVRQARVDPASRRATKKAQPK